LHHYSAAAVLSCVAARGRGDEVFRVLGPGWNRTCQGITRRELVQVGAVGSLGLTLEGFFRTRVAEAAPLDRGINCIFLFLWGGPPQHELWDPKPDAPSDIAGPV